jgi:putative PIN family toxin of toxin-antitoxin system
LILRVIFDSNVFVSAAIQGGASHRLIQEWFRTGSPELIVCQQLLDEVNDVLKRRPRMRKWLSEGEAEEFLGVVERLIDVKDNPTEVACLLRDSADDYLIALAHKHAVQYIVSGDKDLLEWDLQEPPVTSPASFEVLQRLIS